MTHTQLHCPSCSVPIASEDINILKMVAKCSQCHTVFSFDGEFSATTSTPAYFNAKAEILMPIGIEVLRLLSEVQIEVSWRKTSGSFFLLFTIIWNAIVLPMAVVMIIIGSLEMLLFLSLHLTVGLVFLYITLATMLNTTYITVSSSRLVVEHKPLRMPFYPGHDLSSYDIRQLHVVKYEQGKTNGRPVFAFALYLTLKSGLEVKLLKGLKTAEQAQYIEQEIERFLKISDEMVDGEHRV